MDLAFHYPAYRRYWLARLISSAGSALAPVAMAFAVLHLDGRAAALGWVLAAATAPQLLFTLVGGVVADRFPRARVLVGSNLLAAASEGAFAVAVLTGVATVGQAIGAAFITGTAAAFSVPANQGTIKTLVPRRLIGQATALQRSARNTTKIAGPAVAGVLVSAVSPGWALAANALSFLVAAWIIARLEGSGRSGRHLAAKYRPDLPLAEPPAIVVRTFRAGFGAGFRADFGAAFRADFRQGWQGFRSRRWLTFVTAQGSVGVGVWLVAFQLLGPVYADQRLGGPQAWGTIAAAFAAGLFAGSLTSVIRPPDRAGLVACGNYAAAGLFPLALSLGGNLVVLAGAAAIAGFCVDLALSSWSTYLQLSIPDELQSRVESYNTLGHLIPVPAGYLFAGFAVGHLGIPAVSTVLVLLGALVAVLPLASPEIRDMSIKRATA